MTPGKVEAQSVRYTSGGDIKPNGDWETGGQLAYFRQSRSTTARLVAAQLDTTSLPIYCWDANQIGFEVTQNKIDGTDRALNIDVLPAFSGGIVGTLINQPATDIAATAAASVVVLPAAQIAGTGISQYKNLFVKLNLVSGAAGDTVDVTIRPYVFFKGR